MKIDILGLQAFLAIAEAGSFGGAADALAITQTALTRRLQNLEAFVGVQLVERTTRTVALTTIGREFLPQARRLVTELAGALTDLRETGKAQRGEVSIACVPTAGVCFLPRVIQAYSALHPGNRINILDHASSGVIESVLRHEVEFGIAITQVRDPEIISEHLLHDRFVLVCRDDHPLANRRRVAWRRLEPHPLILAGEISGNRSVLEGAMADQGLVLRAQYRVQRSATALGLVAQGVAASIVPALAVYPDSHPRLRVVELVDPPVRRELVLIRRRQAVLSPAAAALHALIAQSADAWHRSGRDLLT
ncbi:MAG: LysR family transcriptional regulator [Burkholderiaceae bacterium]